MGNYPVKRGGERGRGSFSQKVRVVVETARKLCGPETTSLRAGHEETWRGEDERANKVYGHVEGENGGLVANIRSAPLPF